MDTTIATKYERTTPMEPTQVELVVLLDMIEADRRTVTSMQVPEILSALMKIQEHLMNAYNIAMTMYINPLNPFEE